MEVSFQYCGFLLRADSSGGRDMRDISTGATSATTRAPTETLTF